MTKLDPGTRVRPVRLPGQLLPEPAIGLAADPLTRAVQAVARRVDESSLRRVAAAEAGLAFQPRNLLALLTYCYAREIFGSADIEDAMRRDVNFRELCRDEFPGARLLRRFRCENRQVLRDCLATVLATQAERLPAGNANALSTEAQYAEEATRRIGTAMFMDQMELDDV